MNRSEPSTALRDTRPLHVAPTVSRGMLHTTVSAFVTQPRPLIAGASEGKAHDHARDGRDVGMGIVPMRRVPAVEQDASGQPVNSAEVVPVEDDTENDDREFARVNSTLSSTPANNRIG